MQRSQTTTHLRTWSSDSLAWLRKLSSSEKGASGWLMTLPIAEHNFALHKGSFRDALCMRYGWQPPCVCGVDFSVEHALSCSCGGLPSIRHNDIRDLTAKLLTELCSNVSIAKTHLTATYRRKIHPQDIQYRRRGTSGRMCTRFLGGQASACIF